MMKDFLKKDMGSSSFGILGSVIFVFGVIILLVDGDMSSGLILIYFFTPFALIISFIGMAISKSRNYWNYFVPAVCVVYFILHLLFPTTF